MANTHSLDLELSSSQYAAIADAAQTGLDITGDISIEAWIKLEQLPSNAGTNFAIVCKANGATNYSYQLVIDTTDKLQFFFDQTGSVATYTQITANSATVSSGDVGVWRHIACAIDVSVPSGVLYKDGSSIASTASPTAATSIFNGTAEFRVGARQTSGSNFYFDGLIDDVRVWNDIRTSDEININMRKELTGSESNLVGYWRLNNNYLDETSNNNDLTASGSPVFSTSVPFSDTNFFTMF